MHLQAEFDFKAANPAGRLNIQRLQLIAAGLIAVLIACLAGDVLKAAFLELSLLLMFLRARRYSAMAPSLDYLVLKNKGGTASINGRQQVLAAYCLDYFSNWVALLRLTTVAGQTQRFFVFPKLLGVDKYRELLALLKARAF